MDPLAYLTAKNFVSGPGSIFEIFEYTTDGTPYGKPKISSGYAMIKSPGELIYRTTSNQEDVNGGWIHTCLHGITVRSVCMLLLVCHRNMDLMNLVVDSKEVFCKRKKLVFELFYLGGTHRY